MDLFICVFIVGIFLLGCWVGRDMERTKQETDALCARMDKLIERAKESQP